MRLLRAPVWSRLPMEDCEWGSRMIQLFERRPRPNSRLPTPARQFVGLVVQGVGLAVLGAVLAGLLFTV